MCPNGAVYNGLVSLRLIADEAASLILKLESEPEAAPRTLYYNLVNLVSNVLSKPA